MLCGSLDGRGVWEGMDTCISMAEFLCCVPESIKTLLIGYTPIQNKKFNIKKSASKLWFSLFLLSCVPLFVAPWTATHQAFLSFSISLSLLKLIPIELVMLSNHLILCCPFLFLSLLFSVKRVFSNESALHIRWRSIGSSVSASILPMIIQGWFPLGLTGLISLLPKGFSRIFSSTTIWKHQLFGAQPSLWSNSYIHT